MKFVCISLDFELRWGMRHLLKNNFSNYKDELDGTRDAVRALLDYFETKKIQSTWATVGALALSNWEEFFSIMTLSELNKRSGFDVFPNELLTKNEKYYFASDLVTKIHEYSYTELASQTFTHIFNCENQISKEIFVDDGNLVSKIFKEKLDYEPTSIVFPRNQQNYLDYLPDIGIKYYRAIEKGDNPLANTISGNKLINKSRRYISSFIPFLRHSSTFNTNFTRASMFLRLDTPDLAWKLHLSRINNEIINLKDDECFHIWWHPHNLGAHTDLKLKRIDEVFSIILDHRDKGNLQIYSMDNLRKLAENRT